MALNKIGTCLSVPFKLSNIIAFSIKKQWKDSTIGDEKKLNQPNRGFNFYSILFFVFIIVYERNIGWFKFVVFDFPLLEINTQTLLVILCPFLSYIFWSFFLKRGKWEKKIINYLLTTTNAFAMYTETRLKVDPSSNMLFLYDENRLFKKHYLIFFSYYIFWDLAYFLSLSPFTLAPSRTAAVRAWERETWRIKKQNNSKKIQIKVWFLFTLASLVVLIRWSGFLCDHDEDRPCELFNSVLLLLILLWWQ